MTKVELKAIYDGAIESLSYLSNECEYYYRGDAIKDVTEALNTLYLLAGGDNDE